MAMLRFTRECLVCRLRLTCKNGFIPIKVKDSSLRFTICHHLDGG